MKNICWIILLGCLSVFNAQAQDQSCDLKIAARYHKGAVELRWAPSCYKAWRTGCEKGYILERLDESGLKTLTTIPLKPFSLDEWATKTDTSDKWNQAAAQLVHGKMNGLPTTPTLAQVKEISRMQLYALANALITADMSFSTAQGMALAFRDQTVQPGKSYIYRLKLAQAPSDTAFTTITTDKPWEAPSVAGLYTEEGEHSVTIKWSKSANEAYYTAWWVEKSTDKGKTFTRLNREPLFVSGFGKDGAVNFYIDSLKTNYQPAQYRVIGITSWSDTGKPSAVVTGQGRDRTPPGGAEQIKATCLAANKIKVTWKPVVNRNDLAGWYIQRGNDPNGVFTNINAKPVAPDLTEFIDTEPFAFNNNFYKVIAVDTAGNMGTSFSALCYIIDSIAPVRPHGLAGAVDTSGLVALSWDMGTEPDLRGYRVYMSHAPDREYRQLTTEPMLQNYFVDTISLHNLSEKIYYKVVAVDYRFNHSEYSEMLELKKPDLVAPVAPVFKGYQVKEKAISLRWANSSSKDAARLIIWRQTEQNNWAQCVSFKAPFPSQFTDTTIAAGQNYNYALEAIDDDGLYSGKSEPLSVETLANTPVPVNLKVQYNATDHSNHLEWQYPTQNCRFVVLRARGDEPLAFWKSVNGEQRALTDAAAAKGRYRYAVKALFNDGHESDYGNGVAIQVD